MADKSLKKLSRKQLLELMLEQSKRIEELERDLEEANFKLNNKRIMLSQSGSIAEAALKLNDIFESAQRAADQYLLSVQSKGVR